MNVKDKCLRRSAWRRMCKRFKLDDIPAKERGAIFVAFGEGWRMGMEAERRRHYIRIKP